MKVQPHTGLANQAVKMAIKRPVGIMQGRLSPRYKGRYQAFPKDRWKEEFSIAKSLGFDCIEFIYDYMDADENPLITDVGIKEIKYLAGISGVGVYSICADYFMKNTLFERNIDKRARNIDCLIRLIENSSIMGITDITIPCVDESSLKSEKNKDNLKASLHECLQSAERCKININLETDLPPAQFYKLIVDLDHPRIKVNYDIGNSASLGYNPEEELNTYGRYISVLHVKDRLYKGGSVKLGTGNADFELVFRKLLKQYGFCGMIIMQAARAEDYKDELRFVKEQSLFLRNCLERWFV